MRNAPGFHFVQIRTGKKRKYDPVWGSNGVHMISGRKNTGFVYRRIISLFIYDSVPYYAESADRIWCICKPNLEQNDE